MDYIDFQRIAREFIEFFQYPYQDKNSKRTDLQILKSTRICFILVAEFKISLVNV